MIDVTQGLIADLKEIAKKSDLGAEIFSPAVPIALETRTVADEMKEDVDKYAFYGGEDYELCFTAPRKNLKALANLAAKSQLRLTEIGEIKNTACLSIKDEKGALQPVQARAYGHFQQESAS